MKGAVEEPKGVKLWKWHLYCLLNSS
jgi:hypothetical protein